MSTDDDTAEDAAVGTTDSDYRWRWLSSIWALVYGLGFPAWVGTHGLETHSVVLAALVLAWGGTVVYIVGPENVKAWHELRTGGE